MIQDYRVFKSSSNNSIEFLKVEVSDHFFPVHYHRSMCIGRIEHGSMEFGIGDKKYIYNKNDFYVIPAFTNHSCTIHKNTSYSVMCFSDTNLLQNVYLDLKFCQELERFELLPLFLSGYQKKLSQTCSAEIVKKLTSYIRDIPLNQIRTENLSSHMNISQSRLQHVFKAETGMCLKDFIIQEKIRTAKTMLLCKDIPDIVYECGFYDQSHFCRNFKKITGLPPLRYAKSINFL